MKSVFAAALLLSTALPAAETIHAAGATFPAQIYQQWFNEFGTSHPGVNINYQPIGSGGGIRQLTEGTIDFGATDMPLTEAQLKRMRIKPLHFPTLMGAVVISYNVPGVASALKFTPEAVAGIYLETIAFWDDPRIAAPNPGVNLLHKPIEVIHRSDGSGTTFVFTDYLSKVSPQWRRQVGASTSVAWPTGLGAKGNDGVAGLVKQTPWSVGYIELLYAVQNKMTFGDVRNAAGSFVRPSLAGITAAAANLKAVPSDFRISLTNAPGETSYPVSTFTWLLIPSEIRDSQRRKTIVDFLAWMLTDGQNDARRLAFAALPEALIPRIQAQIGLIR